MDAQVGATRTRAVLGGSALLMLLFWGAGCATDDGPGADPAPTSEPGEEQTIEPGEEQAMDDVLGTVWLDETQDTQGDQGHPYLEFDEDGTVRGTDGCNGIVSTYTIDGDRIVIEEFTSTLRACQGVDDWLRGVREVRVDGDVLVVSNADGETIGELQREAGAEG